MPSESGRADMTKKPYASPVITNFGSVRALTRGVGGSNADAGQQNNTKLGAG